MKKTSIHSYNADTGLKLYEKPIYLLLNWLNNLFPYLKLDKRICFLPLSSSWEQFLSKTYKESSISRKLSDLFWWTLPWDKIKGVLVDIHVFDTGCGSGGYGVRIMEASGGSIASYTGIDAKERSAWKELKAKYPNFNFTRSRSSDIRPLIPKETNLFITQTAIEHFDEDLLFFEHIREFIAQNNRPFIQVHIFPAAATLPLYLFHGFRQYTPRTISKITRLFRDNSKFYLFGLGGKSGWKVHFKYFTWPVLLTRKYTKPIFNTKKYDMEIIKALKDDTKHPSSSPLFWALIIEHNTKTGLF